MEKLLFPFVVMGITVISEILGSRIFFSHSPEVVAPPVHHYLTLMCGLNNEGSRLDFSIQTSVFDDQGSAVESTDVDVISVKSLVVTRNVGEKIAHLSPYTNGPELLIDDPNAEIRGNLTQEAHVFIDWEEPTKDLVGSYTCEITAMDEDGKDVVFRSSLGIAFKEPDLDDVIGEIEWMHFDLHYSPIPRTQMGTGVCGSSENWAMGPPDSSLANPRYTTVKGTFETAFPEPPIFRVDLKSIDTLASAALRVKFNVRSVTRTGFEVECITWSGSTVEELEFQWVALSQTIFGKRKLG